MSKFTHVAPTGFGRSRLPEAAIEIGLAVAAAGFTAAIWLSIGAWALTPERAEMAIAARQPAVTHIVLPRVEIVGRRDSLEGTPVATTAQNTAAIPVTLRQ
jgi:hypothetical protein